MTWTDFAALMGFIALCVLVASSGAVFKPGAWYAGLTKPIWVPPNWVFPVGWSVLYVMIAVSGWLVWREVGLRGAPLVFALYAVQLALNAGWSAVFFGLRRMGAALGELVLLWLSIAGLIAAFAPISATAAWLLGPYLLWVSFAGALNLAVWRLNMSPAKQAYQAGGK